MAWDSAANSDAVVANIVLTRYAAGKPSYILLGVQYIATLVTACLSCRTDLRVGITFLNLEHVPSGASGTVFAEVKITDVCTGVIATLRGDREHLFASITPQLIT